MNALLVVVGLVLLIVGLSLVAEPIDPGAGPSWPNAAGDGDRRVTLATERPGKLPRAGDRPETAYAWAASPDSNAWQVYCFDCETLAVADGRVLILEHGGGQ